MAPGADPAFQQEMDNLMLQVDQDNILAVHRAFQEHADRLSATLQQISANAQLGLCGDDPVSKAAVGPLSFGGKIEKLFRVHWDHLEELEAVAARLRDTARSYGHTEDDIVRSLGPATNS